MKGVWQRLLGTALRISTQLYVAIGVIVALTIAAIAVSWNSFASVGGAQDRVNTESLPRIVTAFQVTELSTELVAAAPVLTVAVTPAELARVSARIVETREAFDEQLDLLATQGVDPALFVSIRARAQRLDSNIALIEADIPRSFALARQADALQQNLTSLRVDLSNILLPALDEQLFYQLTGYRELGRPAAIEAQHFTEREFLRYRHLANLQTDTAVAVQLLSSAFGVSNPRLIEPLKEGFESAVDRIVISSGAVEDLPQFDEIQPLLGGLSALGTGPENGFDVLIQKLEIEERARQLLEANNAEAAELATEVELLIRNAQTDAGASITASSDAIRASRVLLLVIAGITVVIALSVVWGFVGRILMRRINELSGRMRAMAEGDLEHEVVISGRDEVTEMAAALEVFRRHALEVQRLNLVEELAQELGEKNTQLEDVLNELQRAQDQIVMREKLAALGEVTAGVAHEIRNPLNFVKNFSEVSAELLEELREVLDEADGELSADQRQLIGEITGDLTDNLERIRGHGGRANRIVHDMLTMSRSTDEWRFVGLNSLVEEHAKLAFHSARASDVDFQLDLQFDMDPTVGEIEALPQDLGRVFINTVGNSCQATDEKRRSLAAAGDGRGYMPTVWVSTRRLEESVEIRVRDNGPGIPPEVIDKIFNPFFTTKPTDQGTGLGLSITNDVMREHGGSIGVESTPGESTEMIIRMPLRRTDTVVEADAEPPLVVLPDAEPPPVVDAEPPQVEADAEPQVVDDDRSPDEDSEGSEEIPA